MIDFIDPSLFYATHINVATIVALYILITTHFTTVYDYKNISIINGLGFLFIIFIIVFIGLRPVSGINFGDMATYARYFDYYANGGSVTIEKDAFFHTFMKFSSQIMPMHMFFLLCSLLYIYPMYKLSKKHFGPYWFYACFMFIVSFSFWNYATNGIRNGIATSLFLWGIAYYDKKIVMFALFAFAALTHQTLLLPIAAFMITYFYNNPKIYIAAWLLAIPLSIGMGGFWETFFASFGFADERLGGYLLGEADPEVFKNIGFRWDFLIYSASAVFTGWYFIFIRKYKDKLYIQLFNTYVMANAFWILVIRASFSNRFAYLSWFMISVIIIYPFLKERFYEKQHAVIGRVIMAYFAFTLFMFYIYYSNKAY